MSQPLISVVIPFGDPRGDPRYIKSWTHQSCLPDGFDVIVVTDGKSRDFWERNLRFKTDVSADGPQKGAPALIAAGMMGDRADVIFAAPEEISGFIAPKCE